MQYFTYVSLGPFIAQPGFPRAEGDWRGKLKKWAQPWMACQQAWMYSPFMNCFFIDPIEARHLQLMFTCLLLLQVFTWYYCYLGFSVPAAWNQCGIRGQIGGSNKLVEKTGGRMQLEWWQPEWFNKPKHSSSAPAAYLQLEIWGEIGGDDRAVAKMGCRTSPNWWRWEWFNKQKRGCKFGTKHFELSVDRNAFKL